MSCGGSEIPGDFPSLATYVFHDQPMPGFWMLTRGTPPIYVTRHVAHTRRDWPCRDNSIPDKNELRLCWLSTLARTSRASLGLEACSKHDLIWTSPEAYVEDVGRLRRAIEGRYAEVVRTLIRGELLPAAQGVPCKSHLVVEIVDRRTRAEVPLPASPGVPLGSGISR